MKNTLSVGWGFGRCNMNCRHCYNNSGNISPQYSFAILKKIADKICLATSSINYGTGEFGFNMCAIDIAKYVKDKYPEINQCVTTNGITPLLMNAEEIKKIFSDIDFSIDHPSKEAHNEFRRHPLAWDWTIRGLEICQKEKIDASIVTCITGLTSNDDIKELLSISNKYGVSWRINWFRPTGRGKNEEKLKLSPERVWDVIMLMSEITDIEALSDPLFDSILNTNYNDYKGCACGKKSCRIQTDLSVTPCVFLKGATWSGGSIAEKNFEQIFKGKPFKNLRNRKPAACQECEFWEKCKGGCASRAFLYRGSLNEPDGFCPIINELPMDKIEKISLKIKRGKEKKVHDGYLCTLIAKP